MQQELDREEVESDELGEGREPGPLVVVSAPVHQRVVNHLLGFGLEKKNFFLKNHLNSGAEIS